MPGLLLLAFLLMPLLELWVILQVGDVIGGGWTVVLLLLDSVLGAVIVRREGRRAWTAFREALGEGRWPADEVAQGALVLVGGALLLTPGFVTDVLGLAFVLPPTRAVLARVIRSRMTVTVVGGGRDGGLGGFATFGGGRGRGGPDRGGPQVPPGGADTRRGGRDEPGHEVLDVEVVSVEREDDGDRGA